ncbi:MAG: M36 family metallopeptidase [Phycisphaeraceae bacterium]|nr:M36 family metallopeptidase [Phycisphaeraceae bacterium]
MRQRHGLIRVVRWLRSGAGMCLSISAALSAGVVWADAGAESPVMLAAPAIDDFDHRVFDAASMRRAGAVLADREAAMLGVAEAAPGAVTSWSPRFLTPTFLRSTETTLTGPALGVDAFAVVTGYVLDHPELFRCAADTLSQTRVIRDAQAGPDGLRCLWLGQRIDGIPVLGCELRATLTADGRIASIGSTLIDLDPANAEIIRAAAPRIDTIAATARLLGADENAVRDLRAGAAGARAEPGDSPFECCEIEPIYVPTSASRVALGHRLIAQLKGQADRYEVITIGPDPTPVILRSLTRYAGPMATYRIYPGESPTPMTPASPAPNGDQPPVQDRTLVTIDALDPVGSPDGWVDPDTMTTSGNNVVARADFSGTNAVDGSSPNAGSGLLFDFPVDLDAPPSISVDAAVTQAFYTGNWFHDVMYGFGFTEPFGSFQRSNFGRGGVENDRIIIDVQDGSGADNARFVSNGADGSQGRVELYLWTGVAPARDSALDNHILVHELTHGVTDRLIGGITGIQGASMGEGWSDYFALSLLTDPDVDPSLTYPFGPYVAYGAGVGPFVDNYYFGLRRFPYTTDLTRNPLTFSDANPSTYSIPAGIPVNPLLAGGNPGRIHQVGEIWGSALWECRAAFVQAEGPQGAAMFDQVVIDSLKLIPTTEPDMIMGRDAVLLADLVRFGGAHACGLWDAFARRGLGVDAFSPTSSLSGLQESFDSPTEPGLVAFGAPESMLAPGPGNVFRFGIDPGCVSDEDSLSSPLARLSVNGGPYTPMMVDEVSPGLFELGFPALLCGEVAQYYIEMATDAGPRFLPEAGAAAPFIAEVGVNPAIDRLRADDREPFDFFGDDIALDGGVLVIGAWQEDDTAFNAGAAYIFEKSSRDGWAQRQKLIPPTDEVSLGFGFRVAVEGDLVAVSALYDSARAPSAGAVHLYQHEATGGWAGRGILTSLDGEANDEFGSGLCIDSGRVYVGSSKNDTQGTNAGAVYVFGYSESAGWRQLRRLISLDSAPGDLYGQSVIAEGDTLIVGAPGADGGAGAVYRYRRTGEAQWTLEQRLTAPSRITGAMFGASLDLDGDRVIIGAPLDLDQISQAGVAYVFTRSPDDGLWEYEDRVAAPFQRGLDGFGDSVSIEGDLAVVSAPRSDLFLTDAGAAFVYERGAFGWSLRDRLSPIALKERIQFGSAVALDGGIAAIGAWLDGEDQSATGSVALFRPVAPDCNSNGVADQCDIASGDLLDADLDGAPDICACAGDLNGDRRVDTADLGVLISQFGYLGAPADLNADGLVDQGDLGLLIQSFGLICLPD